MRIISFVLLLIIILIGITFATLNSNIVTVHYYIGQRDMALSLLLVSVFATGCLLGILVMLWLLIKTKMKNYQLNHRLKLAEREVANLRAIPIQDKH